MAFYYWPLPVHPPVAAPSAGPDPSQQLLEPIAHQTAGMETAHLTAEAPGNLTLAIYDLELLQSINIHLSSSVPECLINKTNHWLCSCMIST